MENEGLPRLLAEMEVHKIDTRLQFWGHRLQRSAIINSDGWAWSLIHNKKPIVLFERHCHAAEKSEAIACARRCQSSWLTRWWT
jgi:hypothetical protein